MDTLGQAKSDNIIQMIKSTIGNIFQSFLTVKTNIYFRPKNLTNFKAAKTTKKGIQNNIKVKSDRNLNFKKQNPIQILILTSADLQIICLVEMIPLAILLIISIFKSKTVILINFKIKMVIYQ